eukprot:TRINITY_DN26989_c0_g1_i1.p1 TRINITY_DN26989_c0_g1~~TRINITY_DN26989_c0_g1_i1.p1  ORF type:complete len:443 (-),score=75.42 TRINITY_DN26989_c0_g1_i1:96-1343(-)
MVAQPLAGREVLTAGGVVVAFYGGLLVCLHRFALSSHAGAADEQTHGFWGTLPSAWDHPEPNYVVSGAIGEFWSVLTTIPVAGFLLLYEGMRFGYGKKVMAIYCMTCCMYSLAFASHLTLQMHLFSTTVITVMSNALLTFALFSHVVHWSLDSKLFRAAIVLVAEIALVGTVTKLPYMIEHGGVWTLFTVQSPGVFLATFLAGAMAWRSKCQKERTTFSLVGTAGSLLSTAMVLSLVECLIGFEKGFLEEFWGFPWLHIAIHVLEQVGIYVFGVGVAALQALLLSPEEFPGAEVRRVAGLSYLYCPQPAGQALCGAEPLARAAEDREPVQAASGVVDITNEVPSGQPDTVPALPESDQIRRVPEGLAHADTEPLPLAAGKLLQEIKSETSLQRRKRTQSPGVSGLVARNKLQEAC